MVSKAHDVGGKAEMGKENFRIKRSLLTQLSARIRSSVEKNREGVMQSMLQSYFLDAIVERFEEGTRTNPAANYRPPADCRMLVFLAMFCITFPCNIEQIITLVSFLFPSLQNDKTIFRTQDFVTALQSPEIVDEFAFSPMEGRFAIRQESQAVVRNEMEKYFREENNFIRLRKSIYQPVFINILLPNITEPKASDNKKDDATDEMPS